LHWQRDVIFREDHYRARVGFAAENLAIIRRLALNFLKKDISVKKVFVGSIFYATGTRIT
jgi:predicted transposase YbfD/YdcC